MDLRNKVLKIIDQLFLQRFIIIFKTIRLQNKSISFNFTLFTYFFMRFKFINFHLAFLVYAFYPRKKQFFDLPSIFFVLIPPNLFSKEIANTYPV